MSATATSVTDLYDFNATTGTFSAKDTSVVKAKVEADIKDVFGLGASSEIVPSTPMGRFTEWLTLFFATAMKVNVQNANQLVLSAAAGQQLDAMALWFGLSRKAATHTTVTATLTGTASVISAGARASTEDGDVFELTENVTLTDGTGTGVFQAVETGPIACEVGTLTTMETSINGWNGVTNTVAGNLGRDIETDEDLRTRIQSSRASGIGFMGAIKNAVEGLDGVHSSMVLDNNTASQLALHGVTVEPHSIFICVDCENNETLYNAIAKAILDTKPCGTGMTHLTQAKSLSVTDVYGNAYTVYYHLASSHEVYVNLTYQNRSYAGSDIEADIRTAIVETWSKASSYKVGETVYATDIIRAVEELVPGVLIVNGSVNTGGTNPSVSYVEISAAAKAHFSAANITLSKYSAS